MFILLVGLSVAATTITRNVPSPAEYVTENSTTVTFNFTAVTSSSATFSNCSLYIHINNVSGAYYANISNIIVANATANVTSIAFTDGDRVWWKVGCWDWNKTASAEAFTMPSAGSTNTFTYDSNQIYGTSCTANVTTNETVRMVAATGSIGLLHNGTITAILSAYVSKNSSDNTWIDIGASGTNYTLAGGYVYINGTSYGTNNSRWTYTFTPSSTTDYNISSGYFVAIRGAGEKYQCSYVYPKLPYVNAANTTERIFDVDAGDYWQLLTIQEGIVITGNTTAVTCNSATAGAIIYFGAKHYGCNGSNWNAFY
jgi:hypothetical protein